MSAPEQTLQCPGCGQTIGVDHAPIGSSIACPYCQHQFEVWRDFKNYRLMELLGEGGMGSVYRTIDQSLNREVAIKVLKSTLSNDSKFIQTFLREVEITASLTHPNVVQVYTFGEFLGQYYLVMEFIGRDTLDDHIETNGCLDEAFVLDTAIGVASGLNFALQRGGLIHRDIKPGNILYTSNMVPKVVDFGLAMTPETADQESEVWGTPYYVSPERLEGIPEDFRSDMYSLGVALYHALTGRPPFDANTAELVAAKHLNSNPLPLKTVAPHISDHTSYSIMKAMSRHPAQRFGSYEEFLTQLEDAKRRLSHAPDPIQTANAMEIEDHADNRHVILGIGLAAALLLIAVGAYLLFS